MAAEVKAIDLLGSSPPIRSLKVHTITCENNNSLDAPDEASKEEEFGSYEESADENALTRRERRKKKVVTFADYSNEPKGINDSHDSDEESLEPQSPFLALRNKRSASLPHIELNPKLNKKNKEVY